MELLTAISQRNKAAVAEAINLVEDVRPQSRAQAEQLLDACEEAAQRAHWVGVTGPPGAGKSTLVSALIQELRGRDKTVGVVAVDPSSKRSGGALLGDRARIRYDTADTGVFVRSMAAGGQLGGLARATQAVAQILAAAFDMVIIETVGVGQSETDIEDLSDTVLYVVQPGSGDTLQFLKAGVMEIPDILVVNKADQEKLARRVSLDLRGTLSYREIASDAWLPKIVRTSATLQHGITDLADAIEAHWRYVVKNGLSQIRAVKARRWALGAYARWCGERGIEHAGGSEALASHLASLPAQSHRGYLRALKERFPCD